MAYIETKTINGKDYMYLRHSIRLPGGRVVHKNIKCIGPVKPIYKCKKKRRDNSWIFARKPTKEETEVLKKSTSHHTAFTKDRAKIILWSSEGISCLTIADKLGCDARKVRKAIREFNEKGIACLERGKAKGAKPMFTDVIKKEILKEFSRQPRACGYHYTTWTLPRFRKHLMDCDVVESISIETVRQILIQSGARLKQSKRRQYSPDKEFDKKNK